MSSIVQSIGDLIGSIFELFGSILQTIFNVFKGAFQGLFNLISSIFATIGDLFQGVFNAAGGVGKFIAGNFFVLAAIGLAVYGFLEYQRRQGKQVKVGNKKLN